MEDFIKMAFELGNKCKYIVYINEIPENMTYLQLGAYLIANQENIDSIKIKLKLIEIVKKFQKLKIELTEENERKLREIHQYTKDIFFEEFVNNYLKDKLLKDGFE